ncbi:hypothetical protein PV327_006675 [Microctonus hyperodae]|uniref:Uncharacterized protein n=1 Tax=Microctonus hyperodae TaxID=165561 RepID=A0AA39F4X8_MICHY|nr:hypothetical protein PV327_006675 [Microctonus hyperodae]
MPTGKAFLLSLPEEERTEFLRFALGDSYFLKITSKLSRNHDLPFPAALGIEEELLDKFQKLNTPENFTTNLYVWVTERYNMDQMSLENLILRRTVCLSNGTCINISDVGSLCCPF